MRFRRALATWVSGRSHTAAPAQRPVSEASRSNSCVLRSARGCEGRGCGEIARELRTPKLVFAGSSELQASFDHQYSVWGKGKPLNKRSSAVLSCARACQARGRQSAARVVQAWPRTTFVFDRWHPLSDALGLWVGGPEARHGSLKDIGLGGSFVLGPRIALIWCSGRASARGRCAKERRFLARRGQLQAPAKGHVLFRETTGGWG